MQIGQPELFVYLKSHDGYETPPRARSFVDRMLGWSDLWYYAKVVRIVVAGGRCARRGGYTREYFARQSYDMLRAVEGSGAKVLVTGLKNLACLTA
ncbi:MAG: hypothetical protein N2255_05740, partial [Kiritimatiellae bacterium]|nr:hypothetical protein [Kiritimatiellia bacterium]